LQAHSSVIQRKRASGRFAEADSDEHYLLPLLNQVEPKMTTPEQIFALASIYEVLGNSHSTYGGHGKGDGTARPYNDPLPPSKGPVNASNVWNRPLAQVDVESAEKLKLKALTFWDKLPNSNPQKIRANRAMVEWYQMFGDAQKAALQTKQLAKIMGTTDQNTLFPPRRPCPGCGMG
jgi:hypothetical protein